MLVLLLALGQVKKIKDDLSLKIEKKVICHAHYTCIPHIWILFIGKYYFIKKRTI